MSATLKNVDRITISLPNSLAAEVELLRKELKVPKSEIFRVAIEQLLEQYRKKKLRKIAEMMASEYENDPELTVFTDLDSEDFL